MCIYIYIYTYIHIPRSPVTAPPITNNVLVNIISSVLLLFDFFLFSREWKLEELWKHLSLK